MTLPASGSISMQQVVEELQIANPSRVGPISLNDSDVRLLANISTGAISLSDLYGKSAVLDTVTVDLRYSTVYNPGPPPYYTYEAYSNYGSDAVLPISSSGILTNATLHVKGNVQLSSFGGYLHVYENVISNDILAITSSGDFEVTKFYSSINVDTTPFGIHVWAEPGAGSLSIATAWAWFTV